MTVDVAVLTDDELMGALTTWAGRVAAGEALVLRLLGELDAREAWAQWGVLSCAHWASWRLGLTLATAREKVRVARCLRALPLLTAQLGAGQVSYAQARAITRVATAADEQQWVDLARVTTAAQLEQAVRGVGRARREPVSREQEAHDAVRVSWDTDGALLLNLRISPAHAPAVLAALESAQQVEQADRDARYAALAAELAGGDVSAETSRAPGPVAPAAGVVPDPHLAADVSAETSEPAAGESAGAGPVAPPYAESYFYVEPEFPLPATRVGLFEKRSERDQQAIAAWRVERDRRQALRDAARTWQEHVQAQADAAQLPGPRATLADALVRALTQPTGLKPVTLKLLVDPASGWARTSKDELLPPSTLRQVLQTLPGRQRPLRYRALTPADLTRHDLGRTGRHHSTALRDLLGHVDGERCRFPSCTRTTKLHAHHVLYWALGGRTDLANLVLVCARHHTLIHAEGFQLVLSPDRTLTVRTKGDIPVPHHPDRASHHVGELDPTAPPLTTDYTGDRFDLGYVVMVLAQHNT